MERVEREREEGRGRHLENGSDPIVILISDLDSWSDVEYHFLTRKLMKKCFKGRKVVLNQKRRHTTNTVIFCHETAPFERPSAKIALL